MSIMCCTNPGKSSLHPSPVKPSAQWIARGSMGQTYARQGGNSKGEIDYFRPLKGRVRLDLGTGNRRGTVKTYTNSFRKN